MPEVLASGKYLRLVRRDGWEWAERTNTSGVVVIAALTPAGEVLLVEQDRMPVGARVLEMPAGLAGDVEGAEDEALAEAARRELVEETGWDAERMEEVTGGPVSAGMTSETLTFFRATGLRRVGDGGGDASEDIVVHAVPLGEVEGWIRARQAEGVLVDPKVYAGLFFLR
ncbi:MAG: NUDIX hydrolase [Alphaproteobacteria bacterium]|nr:NUDIX hydrolase [Alphaproteobacteria bacterium]